jgi:hypothetical protein
LIVQDGELFRPGHNLGAQDLEGIEKKPFTGEEIDQEKPGPRTLWIDPIKEVVVLGAEAGDLRREEEKGMKMQRDRRGCKRRR